MSWLLMTEKSLLIQIKYSGRYLRTSSIYEIILNYPFFIFYAKNAVKVKGKKTQLLGPSF